jgi:CRISPR-associated protein Cmr4
MIPRPYILHALSPLHAGIGQAAELIDLPIARLKGTGIPFLPGSSIKGVLRDARTGGGNDDEIQAVFGPDKDNADKHAGALVCTDARLLALPVRSFRGTFAYVTSPLLLTLAARDLPKSLSVPAVASNRIMAPADLVCNNMVYLEDLDLAVQPPDAACKGWLDRLAPVFGATETEQTIFRRRFAVVDDEIMTFLWETATQLDQRVRIDPATRTVATSQLWLEESLPPETLLIGALLAETSRHQAKPMTPNQVLDAALKAGEIFQFGGKSTVGRGRCRMVPL